MERTNKLVLVKAGHTLIWLGFNVVIGYMLYAALCNRLDIWLWLGYGLIICEGIVLLIFHSACPLTVVARRYSNSAAPNFDIFLPVWLAKYNKRIYTTILFIVTVIVLYQLTKPI